MVIIGSMKILIASDLHGSAKYCRLLLEIFTRENADKLLLLGDILYHGPRNELPEEYSPKSVIVQLDAFKDKIICVQGNCDAEIDADILTFPVVSSLGLICVDGLDIYFAHGHKDAPALKNGAVYLTGHTHVPADEVVDGYYHLNPGSVALPKANGRRGYIIYEDRKFVFRDFEGEFYGEREIPEEEEMPEEAAPAPAVKPHTTTVKRPQVLRRKIVVRRK